jgi:hypothetical protein
LGNTTNAPGSSVVCFRDGFGVAGISDIAP